MRFVIAIVFFVVAAALFLLGVAERTIFRSPEELTVQAVIPGNARFVVLGGETLTANPGTQTITVDGPGNIFIASARSDDVQAWLEDTPFTELRYDPDTKTLLPETHPGQSANAQSPIGSDLWIGETQGEDHLVRRHNLPPDVSLLIAQDGIAPAPANISVTWPLDNSTPWANLLIVGGILLLLLGLLVLLAALIHAKRQRGPRRRIPILPTPPAATRFKFFSPRLRKPQGSHSGRRTAALLSFALPVAILAGCAPAIPETTEPEITDQVSAPLVTYGQFSRIIQESAQKINAADAAADAALAAERLSGPALALRTSNYTARTNDTEVAALPAFPTGTIDLILPQQRRDWPRVVFAAVSAEENIDIKYGIIFVQESAREAYRVHYLIRLTASIPEVAPLEIGAARLAPNNKLLAYPPEQLAVEYSDILLNGNASPYAQHFGSENDLLQESFGAESKATRLEEFSAAQLSFQTQPGLGLPYAFATADTGAIVALELRESETATPAEDGAAINPRGGVKALSGITTTTQGVTALYGIQVLFYVPPLTATDHTVHLLGFSQGLLSAEEVS